jgi:hypothetical protein
MDTAISGTTGTTGTTGRAEEYRARHWLLGVVMLLLGRLPPAVVLGGLFVVFIRAARNVRSPSPRSGRPPRTARPWRRSGRAEATARSTRPRRAEARRGREEHALE